MKTLNSIYEYCDENIYSIIVNFTSTLLGAFLGFVFALIIYWLSNRKIRITKEMVEKEKAYNTLKRFSYLIESVVKTYRKQNHYFNIHSSELNSNPLVFNFPIILATNDIDRLVKSDSGELFFSFMIYDDNIQKFKDYKNIFNHADFLHHNYSDLLIQNEKHHLYLQSELKVISEKLLAIAIRIVLLQKDIEFKEPQVYLKNPEYVFLEKYRKIYLELKGEGFTNMLPYKDSFLKPLQSKIFEKITNSNYADEIAFNISTILTIMDNIVLNTRMHASNLANLNNDVNINLALEYLEMIHEKINKYCLS